jgi:ABC-type antimicrobial peptide transport system permease subunit
MPEVEEWFKAYPLFPRMTLVKIGLYPEEGDKERDKVECCLVNEKRDFLQFYGIQLKEGNWMEENSHSHDIVVNEALLKALNITNPIGKRLRGYGNKDIYTIIGVIKDFHNQAPTVPATPYLFCNNQDFYFSSNLPYVFRYREGTWPQIKERIESLLVNQGGEVWTYSLWNCEEEYDKLIASELTLRQLMAAVSLVCILISLFGIWSMIMLNCEQRRKEIAVRKVYGATVGNILGQFALEYGLLLVVAAAIAFPVGYVCMKPWVEQFNYQITFAWWIFASIFVSATLLVALCVGWRVWRSAKARPADEIAKG